MAEILVTTSFLAIGSPSNSRCVFWTFSNDESSMPNSLTLSAFVAKPRTIGLLVYVAERDWMVFLLSLALKSELGINNKNSPLEPDLVSYWSM